MNGRKIMTITNEQRHYDVVMSVSLDDELRRAARKLWISVEQAMRRALVLYTHAVLEWDKVKLVKKGVEQDVRL